MCFARSQEVLNLCRWSCSGHNGFGLNMEKERPVIGNWALYPLSWQACQSQYHRSSEHICPAQAKILTSKDHIAKAGVGGRGKGHKPVLFLFPITSFYRTKLWEVQTRRCTGSTLAVPTAPPMSFLLTAKVRAHSFTTLTTKNGTAKWPEWSLKGQVPECGFLKLQAYTPATCF